VWVFNNNHSHNQRAAGLSGVRKPIRVSRYLWAVWSAAPALWGSWAKERPCCYNGNKINAWVEQRKLKKPYLERKWILRCDTKAQVAKEKTDNSDFIKIKNFCASKDTIKKVRRQHTEGEQIFVNHVSDKGLVSGIYKEPLQLSNKKRNNPLKKYTKDLNRHFSKKDTPVARITQISTINH